METLRTRQGSECVELRTCLARALCLAMSTTSSCERDFSKILHMFQKRAASPLLKEMQLRIQGMLGHEPGLKADVIRRAQALWKEGFLPCRKSGELRLGNFVSGIRLKRRRQAARPSH